MPNLRGLPPSANGYDSNDFYHAARTTVYPTSYPTYNTIPGQSKYNSPEEEAAARPFAGIGKAEVTLFPSGGGGIAPGSPVAGALPMPDAHTQMQGLQLPWMNAEKGESLAGVPGAGIVGGGLDFLSNVGAHMPSFIAPVARETFAHLRDTPDDQLQPWERDVKALNQGLFASMPDSPVMEGKQVAEVYKQYQIADARAHGTSAQLTIQPGEIGIGEVGPFQNMLSSYNLASSFIKRGLGQIGPQGDQLAEIMKDGQTKDLIGDERWAIREQYKAGEINESEARDLIATSRFALSNPDPVKLGSEFGPIDTIANGVMAVVGELVSDPLTYPTLGGATIAKVGMSAVKGTTENIIREIAEEGVSATAKRLGKTTAEHLATAAGRDERQAIIDQVTAQVEEEAGKQVAGQALSRHLPKAATVAAKATGTVGPEAISHADRLSVLTGWGSQVGHQYAPAISRGIEASGLRGHLAVKAPGIVRMGQAIDKMTDPFSLFGYWKTGRTVPLALSKMAAFGLHDAYGWRVVRRLDDAMSEAGISDDVRNESRDIAGANYTIQAGDRANTSRMVATNSILRSGKSPTEDAIQHASRRPGDIRRLVRDQVDRSLEFIVPSEKGGLKAATDRWRTRAARQMTDMGANPERAAAVAQRMEEREMRALASDHWGFVINALDEAKTKALATTKWTKEAIDRVTFMGPTQLAQQDAKQLAKDIAAGNVTAIRTAVRRFKDLNLHISEGLGDDEIMAATERVLKQIDHALPVRIEDMTDMPPELVDFASRYPDYSLMLRPRDEDLLVGVRNAAGDVTDAHTWLDHVTMRTPTQKVGAMKAIREDLFRGIAGGELERNATRRFAVNMAEAVGLSPHESTLLMDSIRKTAELSEDVAPRGLTAEQIYRSVAESELSTVTKKQISKRVVTDALVDAYENEMRLVGAVPKLTGWAKTFLTARISPVGDATRWVSDFLYPTLRFKKSGLFFLQEVPEGPFFLSLHGRYPISSVIPDVAAEALEHVPAVRRYGGISQKIRRRIWDEKTMAVMDRMTRTSQYAEYDMYESSELVRMGLSAAADLTNSRTPLGRMLENIGGNWQSLPARKARSVALAARYELGEQFRRSMEANHPEQWLAVKAFYPPNMSDGEVAVQWAMDLMSRADPDSFFGQLGPGIFNPSHVGRRAEVSDELLRHLIYGDTAREHTWDDLVREVGDGTISVDQVRKDLIDAGADPDYVERAVTKLTFGTADEFYQAAVDLGISKEMAAGWRTRDTMKAERAGLTLHEYLVRNHVGRPLEVNQMGNHVGDTLFDDIVESMRVRGKDIPASDSEEVQALKDTSRGMIEDVFPTRQADGTLATGPYDPQAFDDAMDNLTMDFEDAVSAGRYERAADYEAAVGALRTKRNAMLQERGITTGRRYAPWGSSHGASGDMTGEAAEVMGIPGYRAGNLNDDAKAATVRYLEGIAESPGTDMPLFSGQRVEGRPLPEVGSTVDLPLVATTSSKSTAHGFSRSMDYTNKTPGYIVEFQPGVRATAHNTDEFLTAGRFKVDSIEEVPYDTYYGLTGHPEAPPVQVVKMTQSEVFDPAKKAFAPVKARRLSPSQQKAAAKVRGWERARADREADPSIGSPPTVAAADGTSGPLYQTDLHTIGMTTPEQYRRQIVTMMDPDAMGKRGLRAMTEQDAVRAIEWYDHIRRAHFALVDDSLSAEQKIEEAARLLVAFGTTQLNTSPADGFRHVFKAYGMRARGETLQMDEARNIVQQAVGLNPEQLQNLVWGKGSKIEQMGIAQKLFDFIDSLTGSERRTNGILGPNGNWGPVAVDIHTKRDFGFLDEAMGDWVHRLVEKDIGGGEIVHGVSSKFVKGKGFVIEMSDGTTEVIPPQHIGGGVPTDHEYDYGVELANDIRDHFNETKFMGRTWNSYEVQALGWYRMQLLKSSEGDAGEVANALFEQSRWMGSNDLVPSTNAPIHEAHPWDELSPEHHRAVHIEGAYHASDEAEMLSGANVLTKMDADAVVGGVHRPAQTVELMTDPTGAEQYLAHYLLLAEQDSGVLMRDYTGATRTPAYHRGVGISVDIPADSEEHAKELLSTLAAEDGAPLRAIGSHTFIARASDGSLHLRTLWEPVDKGNRNEFTKALKASGLVERLERDHPGVVAHDSLVDFVSLKHDWKADPTGSTYSKIIERGSGKHGVMRTTEQRASLVAEYDATYVHAQGQAAKARRMKDDNPKKPAAIKAADAALATAKKERELARAAPGGRPVSEVQQLVGAARVRVRDTVRQGFDRYAPREVRNERERVLGEARDAAGDALGTDPRWSDVLDLARASNGERLYERTPGGTIRAAISRASSDDRRSQLWFNRSAVTDRSLLHELIHQEAWQMDDSANRVIAGVFNGLEGTPYGTWTPGTPLTEAQHEFLISQVFIWASDPDNVHPTLAPILAHMSGKLGTARQLKTEATAPTREAIKRIDAEILALESRKAGKSARTIARYDQQIITLRAQRQAASHTATGLRAQGGLSPDVKKVLDDWAAKSLHRTEDRVSTYSTDEADMLEWAQISAQAAQKRANDLVHMRGERSAMERSINHPFLAMYPSSYMYGKVLPYMAEFLMAKPFGVKAPFLAWTMGNSMNQSFQRQQQYDPELRNYLYKNEPFLRALSMFVPGLPWDLPSGLPFWMRRGIENMMTNNLHRLNGEKEEDFDWPALAVDSALFNLTLRGPDSFQSLIDATTPISPKDEEGNWHLQQPPALGALGAALSGKAPQPEVQQPPQP